MVTSKINWECIGRKMTLREKVTIKGLIRFMWAPCRTARWRCLRWVGMWSSRVPRTSMFIRRPRLPCQKCELKSNKRSNPNNHQPPIQSRSLQSSSLLILTKTLSTQSMFMGIITSDENTFCFSFDLYFCAWLTKYSFWLEKVTN